MEREKMMELIAAHAHVAPEVYFSAGAFERKMRSLFEKIDAKRAKEPDGAPRHPALACFPENIGTFLGLAGFGGIARGSRSTQEAMLRIAPLKLGGLLWAMLRHRALSLNEALFIAAAESTHRIYFTTFSRLAREFRLYVSAGSALLPANELGDNTPEFRAKSRHVYNTSFLFDPNGDCVNVVRKVNVVPTMEDALDLSPGRAEDNRPLDTPLGRVAVAVCYDGFAVPHTEAEPRFQPLALRYDRLGADIIVQPSANPWWWDEPWTFNAPGENLLRRDQWRREGLFGSMEKMTHVRYGVNPHVVGRLFDVHFDGKSGIYERSSEGGVRTLAESARSDISPETEEILLVTVPALG